MSGDTKAGLQAVGFEPVPVLKAIRAKCLDCSGGSHAEVADCPVRTCPLYPFRHGRNPWRAEPSEAQREASRRALAKAKSSPSLGTSGATDGIAATSLPERDAAGGKTGTIAGSGATDRARAP